MHALFCVISVLWILISEYRKDFKVFVGIVRSF